MTSIYSTMEVEAEEIEYKNERSHSIYLENLLHYIILKQDTFRYQVITVQ